MAGITKAIRDLADFLDNSAEALRLRLGKEKAPDSQWKPTVHVLMPDGSEHPFRSKMCMLVPGDGGEPEPEDNQSHATYALLINGHGEVYLDADTGEPAVLPVPAALVRFNDQRMMTTSEVAEMASVDRSTVYRASRAGHLDRHMMEGKHARYLQEQVKQWLRGETKPAKKKAS